MSKEVREDAQEETSDAGSCATPEKLTPKKRRSRFQDTGEAPPVTRRPHVKAIRRTSFCCDWEEQSEATEAAEALTTLSEPSGESDATVMYTECKSASKGDGRRVSFADGPLSGPPELVTPDGHPNHEGQVATRRRDCCMAYCQEPVTKHSIALLESELGPENTASVGRLRRRFGLAPPAQRNLPYVSIGNRRVVVQKSQLTAPVFGKVVMSHRNGSFNAQSRQARLKQTVYQKQIATPEARKSKNGLLDLLEPLELVQTQ